MRVSLGGPGLYAAFTPVGRSFGSEVPGKLRVTSQHGPLPRPTFAPSLISWEVGAQASLVQECCGWGPGGRWNLSEIGGQSGGIQSSTEESAFFSPALSLPTELRGQQPLAPLLRRRLGILVLLLTPPVIPARLFEPPVPPLGNGDNHTSLSGQS